MQDFSNAYQPLLLRASCDSLNYRSTQTTYVGYLPTYKYAHTYIYILTCVIYTCIHNQSYIDTCHFIPFRSIPFHPIIHTYIPKITKVVSAPN